MNASDWYVDQLKNWKRISNGDVLTGVQVNNLIDLASGPMLGVMLLDIVPTDEPATYPGQKYPGGKAQEPETIYTLKILDRQSPYYGQVGRRKDVDEDGLVRIRFPGGDSDWFMPHEFVDIEKAGTDAAAKG